MIFVNLPNHPSSGWSGEQLAAAEAIGGRVVDVAFPEVSPDADSERVAELARATAVLVPPETTHAMVQGEATLTFALVNELQHRGIRVVAATTRRETVDHGDGRRTATFAFVRFRGYSRAARSAIDEHVRPL